MAYSVPEFIDAVLDAADISQTVLAKHVGVAQSTISKWKRGEHEIKKAEWDRLIDFAKKNAKTKHLADDAPHINPLDALVRPYGPDAEAGARVILEAFVKTLPKKR
jgi:transcriptional regulator with XRE-family HTH domain